MQVQTSQFTLEDNVFMSERGPSPVSASDLDVHPRAQVVREGLYQAPKSRPAGYRLGNYDFPPPRKPVAKPSGKSLSGSNIRSSSSSVSMVSPIKEQQ